MNKKHKILVTILSFVMLSLMILPNLKADLDSESIKNAQILADAGIIVDNAKNPSAYNISSSITRREMLKVMLNLSGVPVGTTCAGSFSDLPASDWGCKYAQTALKLGYIAPNTLFRPNDNVSKAESLKMIFKAKGISVTPTTDWRVGYMQKAVELGYSPSFSDYDSASKRSFVFNVSAQTLTNHGNAIKVSSVKEHVLSYEKPKLLLTFASAMNRTSVLSNLKVYPEIAYQANWINDKNLELVVSDLVREETEILVNVLDTAMTTSGQKLENTFTKKFKLDGEALIDFTTPDGNINDLNQNITVRFSKPMVSLTNLDNQAKCPIEITPSIPGKCVWITTSTFQFRAEKGFPTGGKYLVNIPSGIATIAGDTTINSKSFEITTPDFVLTSVNDTSSRDTIEKDQSLDFIFNDEVSLEKFTTNFILNGFTNDKLKIAYYQGKDDLSASKNIVSVFPLTGDWGYGKSYTFKLSKNLTSLRGNVGLKADVNSSFYTSDFLISYNPIVFINDNATEKYDDLNMRRASNRDIITKEKPSIVFNFYKEVELDKTLFTSSIPFEIHYATNHDNEDQKLQENKRAIVLTFTQNIVSNISVKVHLSKYSSTGDRTLTFKTKNENTLVSYKQINYKKACFETTSPVISNLGAYFTFNKYAKVDYAYEVNEWTKDNDCTYTAGKHKYVLSTRLNPSSDYQLTVKKSLPDMDNYPLMQDYNFTFTTPKALNEDKQVSIIDARSLVLVPNDVKPLSVGIQSVNITQAQAKLCVGDLDILASNYLKNSECVTKTIQLNNLGFKTNISVVDLEKIYGKTITKKYVTLEVSKLSADKTDYEAKNDYYVQKTSFVISDIAATMKTAKNNLLWLHNYSSGANLSDSIATIKSYKKEAKYSTFGAYEGEKVTFEKDISFSAKADGIYTLGDSNFSTLLITLKSGEQVILDNVYSYYSQNENVYNYLTTDKPIYKAGDSVSIAGISRILSAKGYTLNTGKIQVYVRDPQYKEVLNTSLSLNALGAFDVSFDLKSDAKLGNYSVEVGGNMLSFAVEEYEKPDFKVTSKAQKDNYLFGESAKIDVSGEYYIGLPLSAGAGDYTLFSSEFYFDGGKTTGYTFGEEPNFWWGIRPMSSKLGGIYYPGNQSSTEKSGKFVLDANGKTTVNIDLEDSTKDKIYTVSTTVTDPNTKKSISTNATFTALRSKTFLGMKFDKYYYAFKESANIGLVATDIDGNKLANQAMNYKVYKIDYTYDENTYKYDTKETLVSEKTLTTNASGLANENFVFDRYGEYRFEISNAKYKTSRTIYVSGGDILRPIEALNTIELLSDKEKYKVGETSKIVINSPVIGVKVLLTIEKLDEVLNYKVIDIDSYTKEVEIDVKKEYLPDFNVGVYIIKNVATSQDAINRISTLRMQMLDIEQQLQKENDTNYIPYLVYDLSRDTIYRVSGNNPTPPTNEDLDTDLLTKLADMRKSERELLNKILPEYFTGTKTLKVDIDSVQLSSNIKLDKLTYLPGDTQKIELTITDNAGKPITGETTLSIIDQSLLALKDNKTDILNYFYSEKGTSVQTLGNLTNLIKRIEFNMEDNVENQATETAAGGALFGDVMEESTMAPAMDTSTGTTSMKKEASNMVGADDGAQSPNATKLRTEFKDLAFYKTKVSVVNGKATFEVPALPDNLTTWVIAGFAYTSDSKVGNYENTFTVQKELSLLPQIPRFFLAGDVSQISALVVNNTSASKDVSVSLDMSGVTIKGEKLKTLSVPAHGSTLATFNIEVGTGELDTNTSTILNLKATSGTLVDALQLTKPIYPSKTSEYVFTNGSTSDLSYEEKVDFGKVAQNGGYLEVSLGATILTNLTKNLDKVLYFPRDDLSSQITFLENSLALQELYKKLEKTSDFEAITLTDYNGKIYTVISVMDLVRNNIKNYVQADSGLAYYKDCSSWWFADTCSSLDVTGKYLNLNITVDGVDNTKVFEYYKKALVKKITENQKYSIFTTEIQDFLPVALFKDSDFVNTYFKPNTTLSNLEKLDYIKMYNLLGKVGPQSEAYLKDLKNAILVEARGSVLPAEKSFSPVDNSVASAKMIQVLIEKGISEKLLTENLVRFLISNRDDAGNYYTYNFSEIVHAINKYVDFTGELKNISFEATAYLNSKDVMTSTFGESNKFDIDKKTFSFAEYLQTGENSLGFEKTGNGKLYYDIGVRYYLPVSEMTSREEGITVTRNYYSYDEYNTAFKKECITPWWYYDFGGYCTLKKIKNIDAITQAQKGDYIVGEIEILLDKQREDVVVNDFIPAGAEILNTNFNTTSDAVKNISGQQNQTWWFGGFDRVEQKDDRIELYAKHLSAGSYKYTYVLKANHIGNYNLKPATAELLEKPEIWGRSNSGKFEIK